MGRGRASEKRGGGFDVRKVIQGLRRLLAALIPVNEGDLGEYPDQEFLDVPDEYLTGKRSNEDGRRKD